MAEQVGYLLLLLALTYFVTLGGGMYGVHEFRLGLTSHLLAISLLLGYGFWKLRQGRLLPRTPLDLPILGFLLVNLLSTILSRDSRLSAENLLYLSVLVLVYYVSVDALSNGWPYLSTVKAILMVGAVVLLLALLELLAWYFGLLHLLIPGDVPAIGWWAVGGLSLPPTLYRLHITLSNSNALAWFLALLMPLAISQFLTTQKVRTKVNLAAWIVLACFVFTLTFSRSGLLALATALFSMGLLYLVKRVHPEKSQMRWVVPVCLAIIVLLAIASLPTMRWLIGWRYATVGVRLELWRAAMAIFARYPILGGGPGTFGYLFHQVADFSPQSPDVFFNSAHNAYLNILTEVGILGLSFGLWLAAALLLAGWRSWRHGADILGAPLSAREQATIAGCTAGLVGLLAMNLIDNNFVFPSITLIAILYAAIIVRPDVKPGLTTRKPVLLVLTIMVALATLWIDGAHYFYAQGIAAAQRGDWVASSEAITKAKNLDPALTLYHFQWGVAQGYLGLESGENEERLDDAIGEYHKEIQRGGNYALNLANLAWLERRAGTTGTAIADMERAAALAPVEPWYRLALGFLAEADGDPEKALAQYAQAVALQPGILDYGFWHASAFRQEALDELPSLALSYLPSEGDDSLRRASLAYYAGDLEKATAWLEPLSSPGALLLLGLIQRKMGNYEAARVYLDRALSLDRAFGPAYVERGKMYLALQQWELAEKDLRMALFLGMGEAHYYLGEVAFQRARLADALGEFGEGLSWSCSVPIYLYHYASDVYHRENLPADFSPSMLQCIPRDGLLPVYADLIEAHSEMGTGDEAKDICNWLLEFYPPSFLEESTGGSCEVGDGSL
jgi:putative inorganic carbon (HCO3(-)) transporter